MPRTASSFARKESRLKAQARVLILCEDKKSSRQYLEDAARYFRAYADIKFAHCGKTDPKGIVQEAVKQKYKYDEVYCAIDRDSHENFNDAIRLAGEKSIDVVVSYPCYEFWLLLHFRRTRKPYAATNRNSPCDSVINDLRKEDGMARYAKGDARDLFRSLIDKLDTARKHAKETLSAAIREAEDNPSTRIHELIDKFESWGQVHSE